MPFVQTNPIQMADNTADAFVIREKVGGIPYVEIDTINGVEVIRAMPTGQGVVTFFEESAEGVTQYVGISGYKTAGSLTEARFGVGVHADQVLSIYNAAGYYFDNPVGIGTANPGELLELSSNSNPTILIKSTDTSIPFPEAFASIDFYNSDGSGSGAGVTNFIRASSPDGSGAGGKFSFGIRDSNGSVETIIFNPRAHPAGRHIMLPRGTTNSGDEGYAIKWYVESNVAAKIINVQVGSDTDQQGLKFYTHPSATGGAANVEQLFLTGTSAVFNDAGADIDFRVEGVGAASALFVQGSDGYVGISVALPLATIHTLGTAIFDMTDNTGGVWKVVEGAREFIYISTINGSEAIDFGGPSDAVEYNFRGDGHASIQGGLKTTNKLLAGDGFIDDTAARAAEDSLLGHFHVFVTPSGSSNDYFAFGDKANGHTILVTNNGSVSALIDQDETGGMDLCAGRTAVCRWDQGTDSWYYA